MKIGVISDIHDNIWKLSAALQVLRAVDTVLCCGDLCFPQKGQTLLINPGEIMGGLSPDQISSLVIYDTETGQAQKVEL